MSVIICTYFIVKLWITAINFCWENCKPIHRTWKLVHFHCKSSLYSCTVARSTGIRHCCAWFDAVLTVNRWNLATCIVFTESYLEDYFIVFIQNRILNIISFMYWMKFGTQEIFQAKILMFLKKNKYLKTHSLNFKQVMVDSFENHCVVWNVLYLGV